METEVATTFISADNTWALMAILVGWAAVSIYLEQKYKWASAVSGAIIGLIGAIFLSSTGIIPTDAPAYDFIWGYIVPLAIPLLLFRANLLEIYKESGRLFILFHISSLGTIVGVALATFGLHTLIPDAHKVAAMMTGSYIGGGVNFVAMAATFEPAQNTINSLVIADNLNMAIYLMILMAIPSSMFFRKFFSHPYEQAIVKETKEGETTAASYWGRKEISLLDIASAMAVALGITTISTVLADFFNGTNLPEIVKMFLGQKYLLITIFSLAMATALPNFMRNIRGAQELGTFLIYIFFVVLGVPANLVQVVTGAPMLLVFCLVAVIVNMFITFFIGRLFKFHLEEMCVASNANIGGPTTAAAMAIARGWQPLIIPSILVGTWGYIIGNVCGIVVGNWLASLGM